MTLTVRQQHVLRLIDRDVLAGLVFVEHRKLLRIVLHPLPFIRMAEA